MKRSTPENAWTSPPLGENDFPWDPTGGIMPKKPKRMVIEGMQCVHDAL